MNLCSIRPPISPQWMYYPSLSTESSHLKCKYRPTTDNEIERVSALTTTPGGEYKLEWKPFSASLHWTQRCWRSECLFKFLCAWECGAILENHSEKQQDVAKNIYFITLVQVFISFFAKETRLKIGSFKNLFHRVRITVENFVCKSMPHTKHKYRKAEHNNLVK